MPFFIQEQEQELWCWAAVSATIERYYSPARVMRQCAIAELVLGRNCCTHPAPCNQAASLRDALDRLGRPWTWGVAPLPFDSIRAQISARRPIAVRIGWYGGGGHFVVIHGYHVSARGIPQVDVADPLFPSGRWDYMVFCNAYQSSQVGNGGGQWTHTYLLTR